MIEVVYARLDRPLPPAAYLQYLEQMPDHIRRTLGRYRRWQDAQASLVGKLLLMAGLPVFGRSPDAIHQLHYTPYNRPYLPGEVDFNISHSAGMVVCALSSSGAVGIDVEKVEPLPVEDFRPVLSAEEWNAIHGPGDRYRHFYRLWTTKEAVIKAEGKGLRIPLTDVKLADGRATAGGVAWVTGPLIIDPAYEVHIAWAGAALPVIRPWQVCF